MKKLMWVGAVAVLVLGAAVVFALVKGIRPSDVAELVAERGARQLRDPMRPPGSGDYVLVIALDGVGADELLAAVRTGTAPMIASVFGRELEDGLFEHASATPGVLSVLPSTTLAAWASVFTGEPPGRTGVPGNEFFVRESRRFYAPAPVTIADATHVVSTYSDDLVGSVLAVPTLYERANVRSYVALSHIHRGADLLVLPDLGALGEIALALVTGLVDGADDETDRDADAEEHGALDREGVDMLVERMRAHGPADLQVVYFPGVDLYTHVAARPLVDQRTYIGDVIDPAIGRLLDAYRAAGILERTYIVFTADHGHTPVLDDDRHALEADGDDEPPAVLQQAGFRLRPWALEVDEDHDFQAAVAYQGAFAYVYLADRSTCPAAGSPCDWSRPPRLEQDVLPVVRAFAAASETGAGVPALRGTLDLILAREPRPTTQDALPFQVWDGSALVAVEEYLARNPRPDLLDLPSRLRGLGAGPYGHRAGDVLLLARSGAARPIEDRFYFSGRYRSWHGSPDAQDSRVPLVVARANVSGAELRSRVRAAVGERPSQLDFVRLVESLLSR